jgi:O-antigen/teichoic acid export membrane protein
MRIGAFVLLPLYTHYISVADFGILALLGSISAIVSSFLGIGIAHATLRFYFEFDEIRDRNAIVSTALITTAAICSPAIFVLSFFSEHISELVFRSKDYILVINITYVSLLFEMARQVGLAYMRAKEYSLLFVGVSVVQLIVQVSLNVYFLAVLKMGITGVVMGNTLTVFLGLVVCGAVVIKECGMRFELQKMRMMLGYSYPFLFSSITGVVFGNADRFILTSLFSLEAVGIYSLGLKFSEVLREIVIEPFQRSFGAFRFSIMKQDNAKEIQSRTLNYLFFVVAWVGLIVAVFSEQVVNLLATPSYHGVVQYIPIIILAQVIGSTGYIFQTGILIAKDTRKLFYINTLTGIIGVTTSCLLIYFLGIFGACISLIIKILFSICMIYKISQRMYYVDYDFKGIIYSLALAIGLYLLSLLSSGSLTSLNLLYKACLCFCFPIVLYRGGVLAPYEKKLILSLVRSRLQLFHK